MTRLYLAGIAVLGLIMLALLVALDTEPAAHGE